MDRSDHFGWIIGFQGALSLQAIENDAKNRLNASETKIFSLKLFRLWL